MGCPYSCTLRDILLQELLQKQVRFIYGKRKIPVNYHLLIIRIYQKIFNIHYFRICTTKTNIFTIHVNYLSYTYTLIFRKR